MLAMRGTIFAFLILIFVDAGTPEPHVVPPEMKATPVIEKRVQQAPPEDPAAEPETRTDPYEGWTYWCDQDWDWACESDADCENTADPIGHRLYCGTPRWARGKNVEAKVCRPGAFGRDRRRAERERLRVFIESVCAPPEWYEPGTKCWQYKWKKARECQAAKWCEPESLARFLGLVILRESTWKPYVRHHLNPDVHAAKTRWKRDDEAYGWDIELDQHGNIKKAVRLREDANRHFPYRGRWSTGMGWYGHNATLHLPEWDIEAPPEILCREVESSEVYLRTARRTWGKISSGIDCDGDGVRDFFGSGERNGKPSPAWVDVHQGASGGKLCPQPDHHARFVARTKRAKIDAYEAIGIERLGAPIPRHTQNERASEIRAAMDAATLE